MSEVKRYDPINKDGTCGVCIEDADYGAYVEYADYDALKNKLDYALKMLENSVEMLKQGDFSTGYCCCGDSMSHPGFGYGHSPVDEGVYHAGLMIREIEEFIENNR